MFDKLFKKMKSADAPANNETNELALAFAALMVETARIDQHYGDDEAAIIDRALTSKFNMTESEAAALRAEAETAQEAAFDIQRFTKIAKSMPQEDKIALIEELWEIVLSDGVKDSYEDTLIRKICGLVYVDDQDSGAARNRVAAKIAQKNEPMR